MGDPKQIQFGSRNTGVSIEYIKRRGVLRVDCWYDGGWGGMEPVEIPLAEFIEKLGIPRLQASSGGAP